MCKLQSENYTTTVHSIVQPKCKVSIENKFCYKNFSISMTLLNLAYELWWWFSLFYYFLFFLLVKWTIWFFHCYQNQNICISCMFDRIPYLKWYSYSKEFSSGDLLLRRLVGFFYQKVSDLLIVNLQHANKQFIIYYVASLPWNSEQLLQSPVVDSPIFRSSFHCKGLSSSSLSIGKYTDIVPIQHRSHNWWSLCKNSLCIFNKPSIKNL